VGSGRNNLALPIWLWAAFGSVKHPSQTAPPRQELGHCAIAAGVLRQGLPQPGLVTCENGRAGELPGASPCLRWCGYPKASARSSAAVSGNRTRVASPRPAHCRNKSSLPTVPNVRGEIGGRRSYISGRGHCSRSRVVSRMSCRYTPSVRGAGRTSRSISNARKLAGKFPCAYIGSRENT
jgi:hypothetical protein